MFDRLAPPSGRAGSELGELPEVLGGGGQEEFIPGAVRPSQAQAVELQDPLEMREQHLDLLPFVPGSLELRRSGKSTGVVAGLWGLREISQYGNVSPTAEHGNAA